MLLQTAVAITLLYAVSGCRSSRRLHKVARDTDTTVIAKTSPANDSLLNDTLYQSAQAILQAAEENKTVFSTFTAKAKIQYTDQNGSQPDLNAVIRIKKDSIIWVSVSATILAVEVLRIYITPDSVIILNRIDKTTESHRFAYLASIVRIPLNFSILQDIIIGNPVYAGDHIISVTQLATQLMIETIGSSYKSALSFSSGDHYLKKIMLSEIQGDTTSTAALYYDGYTPGNSSSFAASRQVSITGSSMVDIIISFKQYEFNNELSFPFTVPPNYQTK